MEKWDELLLQFRSHIDQQIAATDQVEFGKRRVFDQVLLGKDDFVADALLDAVGPALRILGEKARKSFRRNIGGNARRVDASACAFDGAAVNIGGKHLQLETLLQLLHALLQ